ncbi:MAG: hypothetical protein KKA07_17165 [Bacteroidetes bacterium]|nr:hypothetical protein [Bacteroidota bacterium]MBU1720799.1 hypothetical protein [Bacteroidota bacterium]
MKPRIFLAAAAVALIAVIALGNTVFTPSFPDYKTSWAKVDSLESKGLSKSALEVVLEIYKQAKADKNTPQTVKAIIYKLKYESYLEEKYLQENIALMTEEIKTADTPLKQLLHSVLAELYWQYYQNNRWIISARSATVDYESDDILVWDTKKLISTAIYHYTQSLKDPAALQKIQLDAYDPILIAYTNSKKYRPTLYDFLAHRAVDFFMNEEPDIIRPAYKFEIENEAYIASYDQFVNIPLTTKDTMSLKFFALKTLQDIIKFHKGTHNADALTDADLKRLTFVRNKAVFAYKDSLYLSTLQKLEKELAGNDAAAAVKYAIGLYYKQLGDTYNPSAGEKNKWDCKTAIEIFDGIIEKYPSSGHATNAKYQKNLILTKSLVFQTESANLPEKPFKSLITYKNVPEVFVRVCPIDPEKYRSLARDKYGDDYIITLTKLKPVQEYSLNLPNDGDYQSHSVETKVPALPAGFYVILVASSKDFAVNLEAVAYSPVWVSNISFISRNDQNGGMDFYMLHRETGKPIAGVSAQTFKEKYNYTSRKYELIKGRKYTSDENGFFHIESTNDYEYFYVDFKKDDDRLYSDNSFYQYRYYDRDDKPQTLTYFFTDRAIYRPGQTIYFKGIMLEKTGEKTTILTKQASTVTLYDVNYQKVEDLTLITNDYGTFSGTFTAPQGVLNGRMQISNTYGTSYINVEDYKRPKFEVEVDPLKGTYRLNDKITVTGKAKSYAGSSIDGATVSYRVVRSTTFPWWRWWWWGYNPSSPEMEIKNGIATTDETGKFKIEFDALPDKSISKKDDPTFNYRIYVDVTDVNGETHSSSGYVSVGYKALLLSIPLESEISQEKENKYTIYTTNLNAQYEYASGTIKISKIIQPEKTYRKRSWSLPDKFLMTKEEHDAAFPLDPYKDEDVMYKWEKGKVVLEKSFDTSKDSLFRLNDLKKWETGVYIAEMEATDRFGEKVTSVNYFTLYAEKDGPAPDKANIRHTQVKYWCEPGDDAVFIIGSAEDDVSVLYEIEHKGKIVEKKVFSLSKSQKVIRIPITEEHRGNVGYHFAFVKNNRSYNQSGIIYVPYTNKDLDVQLSTYRDKLQPGVEETWKVTIKDKKGEKIAAEMLATMYDASLDAFAANNFYLNLYSSYYNSLNWNGNYAFGNKYSQLYSHDWNKYVSYYYQYYDQLNWFGYYYNNYRYGYGEGRYTYRNGDGDDEVLREMSEEQDTKVTEKAAMPVSASKNARSQADVPADISLDGNFETTTAVSQNQIVAGLLPAISGEDKETSGGLGGVKARTNFAETAFFFPHLETNANGEVVFSFTMPEALTRWKFMALAHTKDLKTGTCTKEVVTQKDLMVFPNAPRFFREGDKITFQTKISNLCDKDLDGQASLMLFDALTNKPIDELLGNKNSVLDFTAKAGQSTSLSWHLSIPDNVQAVTYKIVAKAGSFSDGEETAVPVLTNRMLVTESMPLPIRGNTTKTFKFEKLVNSGSSKTLKHNRLTLEFTSNPAWYAIQALPYLMEYPYECSEQTFSRFYANSIAAHIANSSPRIKQVFDSWKNVSPDALLSNLEKNQELKALLLEETPWVLNAKDESARKRRVGLLFDLNRMSNELDRALRKLENMQSSNGGWPWFEGMPDDRYITQHIVTGFGHLNRLGVKKIFEDKRVLTMVSKAVYYLDDRIREDYDLLKKYYTPEEMKLNHLGYTQIQYLYARTYFLEKQEVKKRNQEAFDYFKGQAKKYWLDFNRYMQGMISLALNRLDEKATAMDIIKSLKDNAVTHDELGMYWKDMNGGYYWYQAPIETQALLIEAFDEVVGDLTSVEEMKIWLLKQKQTQDWRTTKSTVEACFALLLRGTSQLESTEIVDVTLGDMKIDPKTNPDIKTEAGTGYYKTSWGEGKIKPEMGNVTVTKKDAGVAWGALYWQYFEQLDKITPHETPLKLDKKLFVQRNTDSGPVIEAITESTKLKVGDKIKVRIELRVDRDMEYVHMKDMRASGFEPVNVISGYRWQDGLGYYQSTRDAATNFFIGRMNKGTYVFEYMLVVSHAGDFSNGITTIQCMYAPEFTSHSEGIRVKVVE